MRSLLLLSSCLSGIAAQSPVPGLAELWRARSFAAGQSSSWDRSGANVDHGHFVEKLPGGGGVIARLRGRGRITRIWSAQPKGILELLDGSGRKLFVGPFASVFDGSHPLFPHPLTGHLGGGFCSYVPIDFDGLVATLRPASEGGDVDCYYQIGWERHTAEPAPVTDTRRSLATGYAPDNADNVYAWKGRVLRTSMLLASPGIGLIREIGVSFQHAVPEHLRAVRCEIRYGDAKEPAVRAPIGDLFGVAFDRSGVETQAQATIGGMRVLRLPIPIRQRAHIRLVMDDPALPPFRFDARIVHRHWHPVPDDMRYLHTRFTRRVTRRGTPFRLLDVGGAGHFAGSFCVFETGGRDDRGITFLEGDERIEVDGRVALRGTGTEDYFSGAWYFRSGIFGSPWNSVAVKNEAQGRIVASRIHAPDPIPFRERLRFELEHGGANEAFGCAYSALAFCYLDRPEGAPIDLPPVAERRYLPPPPRLAFEVEELEGARELLAVDGRCSGGALAAFERHVPRRVTLPAVAKGRYRMSIRIAAGEKVARGVLEVAGKRIVLKHRPGAMGVTRAPVDLDGRPTPMTIRAVTAELGLDTIRLKPYRECLRDWLVVGPFPSPDRTGFDRVFEPEKEFDIRKEYDVLGNGKRSWHAYPLPDRPSGVFVLNGVFQPADRVVAYARTVIRCERDREVSLLLGSDDGIKAWLNGELIHSKLLIRGVVPDQDELRVRLREGENVLLLKIEQNHGGWGFFARIAER